MTDLWRCTVCGQVSTVGRCCGEETREPWRPIRRKDEEEARRIEAVADRAEQLEAENERLRAEVERSERYAEQSERERLWAEERAERLAEALALLPDEIVMVEHNPYEGPLMFCCGQRVTLSWRNGLEPTHDKKCWYARMRALRDHDKENSND